MSTIINTLRNLDKSGTAYWLENIAMSNGKTFARLDVLDKQPDWIHVRAENPESYPHEPSTALWLNTAHIVFLEIIES